MARLPNALMTDKAYAYGRQEPILDPRFGGQHGTAVDLSQLVSSTKYRRNHTRHMVMEAPLGFSQLPNSEFYLAALKSLVELHAISWEGFNSGLTVATTESTVGGAGEILETPTNVTRERTNPQCTVVDLYGRPFQNMLHDWITYLIMDPETKTPMINTVSGVPVGPMTLDMYSMTILSWEPDPTNTQVSKAWLTAGMYPKGTNDILGKRDLTNGMEHLEISIQWTGVTQTGRGVELLAQTVMNNISQLNANPMMRSAFLKGIQADMVQPDMNGLASSTASLAAQAVIAS